MPQIYTKVGTGLPTAAAENSFVAARSDSYGNLYSAQFGLGRDTIALSGCYFKGRSPTPGTGIVINTSGAFSATAGCLSIFNNSGSKRIVLDYIYLRNTAAGAGYTTLNVLGALDLSTDRFSAGGTVLTVVNPNSDSAVVSSAVLTFGNVTFTAETGAARRLNCALVARTAILTATEVIRLQYLDSTYGSHTIAANNFVSGVSMGPVIIGIRDSYTLHTWFNAGPAPAPSFEIEVGYYEI